MQKFEFTNFSHKKYFHMIKIELCSKTIDEIKYFFVKSFTNTIPTQVMFFFFVFYQRRKSKNTFGIKTTYKEA